MLSVIMLSVIMLSVIMLSVVMPSVFMLSVVMLNVVAPKKLLGTSTLAHIAASSVTKKNDGSTCSQCHKTFFLYDRLK